MENKRKSLKSSVVARTGNKKKQSLNSSNFNKAKKSCVVLSSKGFDDK